jgi:Holliday junction resolvase|tara:strand:+ start:121 stop:462 length:342 start_codon:yes stop_codon:yes gene_type:complete
MGRSQKQKGNRIERKIVKKLQGCGFEAKRTWGSSGRSMGLDDEVDIVLAPTPEEKDLYLQVKGRRKLADYIKPKEGVIHAQILVQDREEPLVVISFDKYVEYLKLRTITSLLI